MRLPNGYGTVYPLSGKRRRKFIVRKTIGWDIEKDKQILKTIGYTETKALGIQMLAEYNRDPYDIDMVRITFDEVYEKWQVVKSEKISKKRISSYSSAYNYYDKICKLPFLNIKTMHLQDIIDSCKYGYDTKMNIKILYYQLYDYAKNTLDLPVKKNYAESLDIGQREKSTLHTYFSNEEIIKLWKNVDEFNYIDTLLIMIYTGLRPSELLQIETSNVFIKEKYMVGGIKTTAGIDRIIPICDKILPLIENRLKTAKKHLITKDSKEITYSMYRKGLNHSLDKLSINHIPHDCRHTFATKLDELGANKICVKKIMGHSISDITDGTYTHKDLKQLLDTVNLLNKIC